MNFTSRESKYNFLHNQLDLLHFEEILSDSKILKNILNQGVHLLDDFDLFMVDLFLMLYKINLIHTNNQRGTSGLLITSLSSKTTTRKVRTRTVGSKYETYIIYKFFMDNLFEKLRGSKALKELIELTFQHDQLSEQLETIENEKPEFNFEKTSVEEVDHLTKEEVNLLNTIKDTFNKTRREPLDINSTLQYIIEESLQSTEDSKDNSDQEGSTKLEDAIKKTKEELSGQFNPDQDDLDSENFLETLSKELDSENNTEDNNALLKEDLEEENVEIDSDNTTTINASFDSSFKEMILDVEKRSETKKSQQLLSEGQFKNQGSHWLDDLDMNAATDQNRIEDGGIDQSKNPLSQTTHDQKSAKGGIGFLDSTLENNQANQLLNHSITDLSSALKQQKQIKHRINKLINALNLERMLSGSIEKLDQFNTHLETLNIQKNTLQDHSFDEALDFFKRIEDPVMIKFLNKVGRKKDQAAHTQYQKHRQREILSDRIILSDDLDNLVDEELMPLALDIEAFENDFIDRFLHQNIRSLDQISKTSKHKGPIILCYDGSGSMEGNKIKETKAHIIAFIEIARIQKRKLITIQFASANEPLYIQEIHPKRVTSETITNLLDTFIRGGTDFEKPLKMAMEYIQTDRYKHADILFITDGVCDISTSFKAQFNQVKSEKEFKLYALIIHGNTYEDFRDLGDITDEVLEIKQRDLSDWNEKISERIFSI